MGKLIVIEGTDGSGKSTQFSRLTERLAKEGMDFRRIVFPRYSEPSSALIRMYLGGEFGDKPTDVNCYAASTFYAVDRYASYKQDWGKYYEDGGVLLADRYTTSNAVHQASKLNEEDRAAYWQWLAEFEYRQLELPKPDAVIYLDVPTEFSERMLRGREAATDTKADIHEKDMEYLATCRKAGRAAAEYYGWHIIQCVKDGQMRSIEDIHEEIYSFVIKTLYDEFAKIIAGRILVAAKCCEPVDDFIQFNADEICEICHITEDQLLSIHRYVVDELVQRKEVVDLVDIGDGAIDLRL